MDEILAELENIKRLIILVNVLGQIQLAIVFIAFLRGTRRD